MNSLALEIWDDEGSECTFYTVRVDDSEENETDKFFAKHEIIEGLEQATQELLIYVLKTIGEDHGAKDELFNRDENQVKGLPHKGKYKVREFEYYYPEFPLRLYAMKIRENIVVLFNGGIKDGDTNQTSICNSQWRNACAYAIKIDRAIVDGMIIIDEKNKKILDYTESEEIVL